MLDAMVGEVDGLCSLLFILFLVFIDLIIYFRNFYYLNIPNSFSRQEIAYCV